MQSYKDAGSTVCDGDVFILFLVSVVLVLVDSNGFQCICMSHFTSCNIFIDVIIMNEYNACRLPMFRSHSQ